jgi:hypothetical protein
MVSAGATVAFWLYDVLDFGRMPQPHPTRLLTTRLRTAMAVTVTGFVFLLALRETIHPHAKRGWLLPLDFMLHGWPLVAVNVAFYGYFCWLAFWFIRGTRGRERAFMVGWSVALLLYPLKILHAEWVVAISYVGVFGWAVSLFAAVSLLFTDPQRRTHAA